jgi:hypothetical protein
MRREKGENETDRDGHDAHDRRFAARPGEERETHGQTEVGDRINPRPEGPLDHVQKQVGVPEPVSRYLATA